MARTYPRDTVLAVLEHLRLTQSSTPLKSEAYYRCVSEFQTIPRIKPENKINSIEHVSKELRDLESNIRDEICLKIPENKLLSVSTLYEESLWNQLQQEYRLQLESGCNRVIFYQGSRGSGKSTEINYLISQKSKFTLGDEQQAIIIRGSAEEYKRFKQLERKTPDSKIDLKIENYFKIVTASLITDKKNEEPFKSILEAIYDRKDEYHHIGYANLTVRQLVDKISQQFRIRDLNASSKDPSYKMISSAYSSMQLGADINIHHNWYKLWTSFHDYCSREKIRLVYVFDGIDNYYSLTTEDHDLYKQISDEVIRLCDEVYENTQSISQAGVFLITVRPETYALIDDGIAPSSSGLDKIALLEKDENFEAVLEFKATRIHWLLRQYEKSQDKDVVTFLRVFREELYLRELRELSKKSGIDSAAMFHGNIRTVLYNYLSFATSLTFLQNKFNLREDQRKHHFCRNLFLGGCSVVHTGNRRSGSGKYATLFPSLFHVPQQAEGMRPESWHVLLRLRMLQIFLPKEHVPGGARRQISYNRQVVIDTLVDLFNYPRDLVETNFGVFLEHGLIEPTEELVRDSTLQTRYAVTDVAYPLVHLVSNRVDVLLYLFLDINLPKLVFDEVAPIIEDRSIVFFEKAWRVVFLCLRHIFTIYDLENRELKQKIKHLEKYRDDVDLQEILLEKFCSLDFRTYSISKEILGFISFAYTNESDELLVGSDLLRHAEEKIASCYKS